MEEFCNRIAEILEIDKIGFEQDFRTAGEFFDSMMGFQIIVMMDNEYDYKMSVAEFLECETCKDLYSKIKG